MFAGIGRALSAWGVRLFRSIPLFGELVDTPPKHQKSAIKEMLWTTVLATLPIWFFPIAAWVLFRNAPSVVDGIWSSISQGDLYLYSAGIVGPLMFALTTSYGEWDTESATAGRIGRFAILFPYGTWFITISFGLVSISTFFFGFIRYNSTGQIETVLNSDLLVQLSIWIYAIANMAMLLVIAYRNRLQNFVAESKSEEHDFVNAFLRGGDDEH